VKVLIAEDELVSRTMLVGVLTDWGHEVRVATNRDEAWQVLEAPVSPSMAILDWEMPAQSGQICRRLREKQTPTPVYIILLTNRIAKPDIVAGLRAGAND
jgi:DNA-binding response OmpR family regulator